MIELLSPVGDFECLKAAVQNGADSVYLGAELFSARAFAHNFSFDDLKKAIEYAKLRGVKTNLTLNTLIKDSEFENALLLAKHAYEYGIDAIIVQDLGLALKLIEKFPDLPIHASTQMTVHNLNGALELQKLGFKRVVLARELSTNEIDYICKNSNIEIECFIHGALCISYSGQCLFSSMIGGRSGNRGKCAGPCRLPYELYENEKKINSGYLLSTRDLCGLDYIPDLINSGVKCLKIEGRMKSPEYVAIVTRIYRKYIDLALSKNEYTIDKNDRKMLIQVFNRGMSSSGHFDDEPNKDLVFKEKPSNMGIYLGKVEKYNKNKGHITLTLKDSISTGDTISLEKETGSYTVSELMSNNKNITDTKIGQTVTIGRMKGNINPGNKIYKLSSKQLSNFAKETYKSENRKVHLNCIVTIKKGLPISIEILNHSNLLVYKDLDMTYTSNYIPEEAKNKPLDIQTVINQISKTSYTPYVFDKINVNLDDNVFLPKLSILNELRRNALENVESFAISKIHRNAENFDINTKDSKDCIIDNMRNFANQKNINNRNNTYNLSLLLNTINIDYDYSKLDKVDKIYIPLKYFSIKKYENILKTIRKKADLYIYMPTIVKGNYKNLFFSNVENAIKKYSIQGFVISNICNIMLLNSIFNDLNKYFKIISNYTFNVFNKYTVLELKKLGISTYTLSPELDKDTIFDLSNYNYLKKELIVYGKTPVLNMNYCLLRRI